MQSTKQNKNLEMDMVRKPKMKEKMTRVMALAMAAIMVFTSTDLTAFAASPDTGFYQEDLSEQNLTEESLELENESQEIGEKTQPENQEQEEKKDQNQDLEKNENSKDQDNSEPVADSDAQKDTETTEEDKDLENKDAVEAEPEEEIAKETKEGLPQITSVVLKDANHSRQYIDVSATKESFVLPKEVIASYAIKQELTENATEEEKSKYEPFAYGEISVPVTWTLDKELSTKEAFIPGKIESEDQYVYTSAFASELEGYEYAEDIAMPTITVLVQDSPAFEQSVTVDGITITVTAEEGVFPEGVNLEAELALDEIQEIVNKAAEKGQEFPGAVTGFDIRIVNEEGKEIEPNIKKGKVNVSFSMPKMSDATASDCNIYHVLDNGTIQKLDTQMNAAGTVLTAQTEGFSTYILNTPPENEINMWGKGILNFYPSMNGTRLSGTNNDLSKAYYNIYNTGNDGQDILIYLENAVVYGNSSQAALNIYTNDKETNVYLISNKYGIESGKPHGLFIGGGAYAIRKIGNGTCNVYVGGRSRTPETIPSWYEEKYPAFNIGFKDYTKGKAIASDINYKLAPGTSLWDRAEGFDGKVKNKKLVTFTDAIAYGKSNWEICIYMTDLCKLVVNTPYGDKEYKKTRKSTTEYLPPADYSYAQKPGYILVGWELDGSKTIYKPGEEIVFDDNLYFRPVYKEATNTASIVLKKDGETWAGQKLELYSGGKSKYTLSLGSEGGSQSYFNKDVVNGTYQVYLNGHNTGGTFVFNKPESESKEQTLDCCGVQIITYLNGTESTEPGQVTLRKNGQVYYTLQSNSGRYNTAVINTSTGFTSDGDLEVYVNGVDTGKKVGPGTDANKEVVLNYTKVIANITDDAPWKDAEITLRRKDNNAFAGQLWPEAVESEDNTVPYTGIVQADVGELLIYVDGKDVGYSFAPNSTASTSLDLNFYTARVITEGVDVTFDVRIDNGYQMYELRKQDGSDSEKGYVYEVPHVYKRMKTSGTEEEAAPQEVTYEVTVAGTIDTQNNRIYSEDKELTLTYHKVEYVNSFAENEVEMERRVETVYIRQNEVLPNYQGNVIRSGYTFHYWSEEKWAPTKKEQDCPNIIGDGSYRVNKDLILYAVYMSPTVIIGDLIYTNEDGTVDGGNGQYVRMGNLLLQGFDSAAGSIRYLYITTTGIGNVRLKKIDQKTVVVNGATTVSRTEPFNLKPGRDKIAIDFGENNPVSIERAQEFLRKNIIFTPDTPTANGKTDYTICVEVMDHAGEYVAANAVGDKTEGNIGTNLSTKRANDQLSSGVYYVDKNLEFKATKAGQSGLRIASGATVYIIVKPGCTLTCIGGNASGTSGGGAGIYLPSNAKLYLIGNSDSKVIARGGNAANGVNGSSGSSGKNQTQRYGGKGGKGGYGGGGAGAGIGTNGGAGGSGGGGGAEVGPNEGKSGTSGIKGDDGSNGSSAAAAGTNNVFSTVTLSATGGQAGTSGGTGGQEKRYYYHTKGSGGVGYCSGDGGNGGGGGAGKAGEGIGTGGGGGAGGGGGGSGATDYSSSNADSTAVNATCIGGAGGGGQGAKAGSGGAYSNTHDSGSVNGVWSQTGGNGGSGGSAGANATKKTVSADSNKATFGSNKYQITFVKTSPTAKQPAAISYVTDMANGKAITLPTYTDTNKNVQFLGWDVRTYANNAYGGSHPFTEYNARYKSGQVVTLSKGTYGNIVLVAITETIGGIRKDDTQIGTYSSNAPEQKYYTYSVKFTKDEADDTSTKRGSIYIGETLVSPNPDNSYTLMTTKPEDGLSIKLGGIELATTEPFGSETTSETVIPYSSIQVTVKGIEPTRVKLVDADGNNGPALNVGQTTGEGSEASTTYRYECLTKEIEKAGDQLPTYKVFVDGKDTGVTVPYGESKEVKYYTNTIEIKATGFNPENIKSVDLRAEDDSRVFPKFVEITEESEGVKKAVYKVSRFAEDKAYTLYVDDVKITDLSEGSEGSEAVPVTKIEFKDANKTYTYAKTWYTTTVRTLVDGVLTDVGAVELGSQKMTRAGKGISVYESGDATSQKLKINGRIITNAKNEELVYALGHTYDVNYYTITYQKSGDEDGTMPVDSRVYLAGDEVTLLTNEEVTYGGKTFIGWTINDDTTPKDPLKDTEKTVTANGTLTAKATWRATSFDEKNVINNDALEQFKLTLSNENFVYNGNVQIPEIKVSRNGKGLRAGRDYKVTYTNSNTVCDRNDSAGGQTNAINAGTVTVKVEGIGDYAGTLSDTYTIDPRTVYAGGITADNREYNGSVAVNVNTDKAYLENVVEADKNKLSIKNTGKCYLPSANARTYENLNLQGLGLDGEAASNYVLDSLDPISVTIFPKTLTADMFNQDSLKQNFVYNGEKQRPEVLGIDPGTIKKQKTITEINTEDVGEVETTIYKFEEINDPSFIIDGKENSLLQSSDYRVDYTNNQDAGTATITISTTDTLKMSSGEDDVNPIEIENTEYRLGNYTGEVKFSFEIEKREIWIAAEEVTSGYLEEIYTEAIANKYQISDTNSVLTDVDAAKVKTELGIRAVTSVKKGYAPGEYNSAVTIAYNDTKNNYMVNTIPAKHTVNKSNASNTVVATGYTGVYDGNRHSIQVALQNADDTAKIYYKVVEESSDSGNPITSANYESVGTLIPEGQTAEAIEGASVKDAGTYKIYYYITSDKYADTTGYAQVMIAKKPLTIKANKSVVYGTDLSEETGDMSDIEVVTGAIDTGWIGSDQPESETIKFRSNNYQKGSSITKNSVTYDLIPVVPTDTLPWANYDLTIQVGSLSVTPRPVTLTWSPATLTYNGQTQSVTASIDGVLEQDKADVTPVYDSGSTREAVNVSELGYTAKVTGLEGLKSENYTLADNAEKSHAWNIQKATNSWLIEPQIQGWDTNQPAETKKPIAIPQYGTVKFTYAKVENGTAGEYSETVPTEAGTYKLKAIVEGTNDYDTLSSGEIEFTITSNSLPVVYVKAEDKTIPYGTTDTISAGVSYYKKYENSVYSEPLTEDESKDIEGQLTITTNYNSAYPTQRAVGEYQLVPSNLRSNTYNLVFVPGTLTVEKKEISPTWSTETTFTYNGRLQGITASIGDKGFNSDNVDVAYSSNTNQAIKVGKYTAEITELIGADKDNYKLSEDTKTKDWKIEKASSIAFTTEPSIANWYYGETPKTPVGESDFGEVTFQYQKAGNWLIFNPKTDEVPTEPGTYNLIAIVSDGTPEGKISTKNNPMTFTIHKAEVVVNAEDKTRVFNTDNETLTYTDSITVVRGVLDETKINAVKEKISISTTAEKNSPIGTYPITIADASTDYATITGIGATYTINYADITFTGFGNNNSYVEPKEFSYNGRDYQVNIASLNNDIFTVYYSIETELNANNYGSGQTTPPVLKNAGNYTIFYYIVGDNYEPKKGSATVTISKKQVTASVINKSIQFGEAAPTYAENGADCIGFTGLVDGETNADTEITWTYDLGGYTAGSAARSYTINAIPANTENSNYEITNANSVTGTLVVDKISLKEYAESGLTDEEAFDALFTLDSGYDYSYNGTAKTPSITVKEGKNINIDSDLVVTYENNTDAGTATVTVTAQTDGNFTGSLSKTFQIAKANVTIKAKDANSNYNADIQNLEYEVTSGTIAEADKAALEIQVKTTARKTSKPGNYVNTITYKANSNYVITVEDGVYTVNPGQMTVVATNYEGVYDGKEHTGKVTAETGKLFTSPKIYYSNTTLDSSNYSDTSISSTTAPTYSAVTEATGEKVYYYVVCDNYAPVAGSFTVKITKRPVYLNWTIDGEGTQVVKQGESAPQIQAIIDTSKGSLAQGDSLSEIQYVPAEVNGTPGEQHTVTAKVFLTNGENYEVYNSSFNYTIVSAEGSEQKLENEITSFECNGWNYGDEHAGSIAVPKYGQVTYTYYTNAAGTTETTLADGAEANGREPKYPGTYYVKATVEEGELYEGTASTGLIEFTISPRPITVIANDVITAVNTEIKELTGGYTIVGGLVEGDERSLTIPVTTTANESVAGSYPITIGTINGDAANRYAVTKVEGHYLVTEDTNFPYQTSVTTYDGPFDGNDHGVTVTVTVTEAGGTEITDPSKVKVYYSTEPLTKGNYDSGEEVSPQYRNEGEYPIYYCVKAPNCEPIFPEPVQIKISKKALIVKAVDEEFVYGQAAPTSGSTGGAVQVLDQSGNDAEVSLASLGITPTLSYDYQPSYTVGTYSNSITPSLSRNSTDNYTFTVQAGTLTVKPRPVSFRWSKSELEYTGGKLGMTATVNPNDIVNGDAVEVGEMTQTPDTEVSKFGNYTSTVMTLTGAKASNYTIDDSEPTKTKGWKVVQAPNVVVENLKISNCSFGETPAPTFKASFGTDTAQYLYSTDRDGEFGIEVPTMPGIYYVKAKVSSTTEYGELETDPVRFEIRKSDVVIKVNNVYAKVGETRIENDALAYTTKGTISSSAKLKVTLSASPNMDLAGSYSITATTSIEGGQAETAGESAGEEVAKYYNVTIIPGKYIVTESKMEIESGSTTNAIYDGTEHGITLDVNSTQKYNIYYKTSPASEDEKTSLASGNVPDTLDRLPITRVNGGQTDVYYYVVVEIPSTEEEVAPSYEVIEGMETIKVGKAPLIVTAKDKTIRQGEAGNNAGVIYGEKDASGEVIAGFVSGDDESVLDGVLSYDYFNRKENRAYKPGDSISDEDYQIIPKGLSSDNYEITYKPGTLKVKQGGPLSFKVYNPFEDRWVLYDDLGIAVEDMEEAGIKLKEIHMIANYEIMPNATMTIPEGYTLYTDVYTLTNSGGSDNRPGIVNNGTIKTSSKEDNNKGAIINKSKMQSTGTIENDGTFTNATKGSFDITGTFENKPGSTFSTEAGSQTTNNGTFVVDEATFTNNGTFINNTKFTNNGTGTIAGTFENNNQFDNNGQLNIINNGSLTNKANSSLHNETRGTISLSGTGELTNENMAKTVNDGKIENEGYVHNYGDFENTRSGAFVNKNHFCTGQGGETVNNGEIDNNGGTLQGHSDTSETEDGTIINNATITGGEIEGKVENKGGGIISKPSVLKGTFINQGEIDLSKDPATVIDEFEPDHKDGGRVVTIDGALPIIESQPIDRSVEEGGKVSYNVIARSESPLTYQWYEYNTNTEKWSIIEGATEKVLEVKNVTKEMDGFTYRCMISNDNGSVNSALVLLNVITESAKGSVMVTFTDGEEAEVFDTLEAALAEINKRGVDAPTIQIIGAPVLVPGPKTTLPSNASLIVEDFAVLIVPRGVTLEVPENANLTVKPDGKLIIDEDGTLDLKGNAEIKQGGQLLNDGNVKIESGGRLKNEGTMDNGPKGALENEGTLENAGTGTLHNDGDILNNAGGKVINNGDIQNEKDGIITNKGEIENNKTFNNEGELNNEGTLKNNGTQAVLNNGGAINNDGTIETNGTINNKPDGTINNDGTIDNDGTINNDGDIDNDGTINNNQNGTIDNDGTLQNDGTLDNDGHIENKGGIENTGNLVNDGDIDNEPGNLHNTPSGTIDNNGDISSKNSGSLTNDGVLDNKGGSINGDEGANGPTQNAGEILGGRIHGPLVNEPTGHISVGSGDEIAGEFTNRGTMDIDEGANTGGATVKNLGGGKLNFTDQTNNANAPVIAVQPLDRTVTAGSNVTFSLTVESEEGVTYQWYQANGNDWVAIPNAVTRNLVVENITEAQDGQVFKCIVSNKHGSTASNTVAVHLVKDTHLTGAFKVTYADDETLTEEYFDTLEEAIAAAENRPASEGNTVNIEILKTPVILDGDVTIPEGVQLKVGNGVLVEMTSGTLLNEGKILVDNGGTMIIGEESTLDNAGDIEVKPTGRLIINGKLKNEPENHITNAGAVDIGPEGDVENGGTILNNDDGTINNDGHISNTMEGNIENNGTFNNDGDLENDGKIKNNKNINNGPEGEIINHQSGAIEQKGTLQNEGEIRNDGTFKNEGVTNNKPNGHIENETSGTFTNEQGGTLNNEGNIDNNGIMENNGSVENDGDISSHGDGTLTNRGDIDNKDGVINGSQNAKGETVNEGSIKGGTINGKFTNEPTGVVEDPDVLTGEFTNKGVIVLKDDADITKANITEEDGGTISKPSDLKIHVSSYPVDATVKPGGKAIFQVIASAETTLNYQWYVNTGDGSGWQMIATEGESGNSTANTNRLVIESATAEQTGYQYRCVVSSVKNVNKGDSGYEDVYKEQFGEDYEDRSGEPKVIVTTESGEKTFATLELALQSIEEGVSADIEIQGGPHDIASELTIPAGVSVVVQDDAKVDITSSITIAIGGSLVIRGRANVTGTDKITCVENSENDKGNFTQETRKDGALQVSVGSIATPSAKLTVVTATETQPNTGKIKVTYKNDDGSNPVIVFYDSLKAAITGINTRTEAEAPNAKADILIAGTSEFVEGDEDIVIPDKATLTIGRGGFLGVEAPRTITNNGTVNIEDGGIVHIRANAKLENKNTLDIQKGGKLIIDGLLDNNAGAVVDNKGEIENNGKIENDGSFDNDGNIQNKPNSSIENKTNGDFINDGTIDNDGTIKNDKTFINNGDIDNDGAIENNDTFTNKGTIENDGTIDNDGTFINDEKGTIGNDGTITNKGELTNKGDIQNENGTLKNDNTGVTKNDGVIKGGSINGSLVNGPTGVIDKPKEITGDITNNGTLLIDDNTNISEDITIGGSNQPINTDNKDTPIITAQPDNVSVYKGDKATFKVTATSTQKLKYQWYVWNVDKWEAVTGNDTATTATLVLNTVAEGDNGKLYKCEISTVPEESSETPADPIVVASNTAKLTVKNKTIGSGYKITYTDGNLPKEKTETYPTLEAALQAAKNDNTDRPIQITTNDNPIVITQPVTIPEGVTLTVKPNQEVIIRNPGSVTNEGTIDIEPGGKVTVEEKAALTNTEKGTIDNDGTVENKGTFTNDGEIDNNGGTLQGREDGDNPIKNNGHIEGGAIAGPLVNQKGGTIDRPDRITGDIDNYGTIDLKKDTNTDGLDLTKRPGSSNQVEGVDPDHKGSDNGGSSNNQNSDSGDEDSGNPIIDGIKDLIDKVKDTILGEEDSTTTKQTDTKEKDTEETKEQEVEEGDNNSNSIIEEFKLTEKEVQKLLDSDSPIDQIIVNDMVDEAVKKEFLKSDDADVEKSHKAATTGTVAEENLRELAKEILTDDEMIQMLNGVPVNIWVELNSDKLNEDDVQVAVDNKPEGTQIATIFDIAVLKQIGDKAAVKVDEVTGTFKVNYQIPEEFRPTDGSMTEYQIMRIYTDENGNTCTELIAVKQNDFTLTFQVDSNSKYVLICDEAAPLANVLLLENFMGHNCYMHWLALLVAILGILLTYRSKKRKEKVIIAGTEGIILLVLAILGSCTWDYVVVILGILGSGGIIVMDKRNPKSNLE